MKPAAPRQPQPRGAVPAYGRARGRGHARAELREQADKPGFPPGSPIALKLGGYTHVASSRLSDTGTQYTVCGRPLLPGAPWTDDRAYVAAQFPCGACKRLNKQP